MSYHQKSSNILLPSFTNLFFSVSNRLSVTTFFLTFFSPHHPSTWFCFEFNPKVLFEHRDESSVIKSIVRGNIVVRIWKGKWRSRRSLLKKVGSTRYVQTAGEYVYLQSDTQCETSATSGTRVLTALGSATRCHCPNLRSLDTGNVPWRLASPLVTYLS